MISAQSYKWTQQTKPHNTGATTTTLVTHSTRSGGDKALKFTSKYHDLIKIRRWSSESLTVYIHERIRTITSEWTATITSLTHPINI